MVDGSVIDDGYGYPGAGIYNMGDLTVMDSTISNNYAYWTGGGIANVGGIATVRDSIVTSNTGLGGGVFNDSDGTFALIGSTVSGNDGRGSYAINFGGGIQNAGAMMIEDSTFEGNSAYWGGGIVSSGVVDVHGSTFVGNNAVYGGGILFGRSDASLSITNSTFSGNGGFTAGVDNGSGLSAPGSITIVNTTFYGHVDGPAIFNDGDAGDLSLANTVISGIGAPISNCAGPLTDLGNNLADDTSCGTIPDTLTELDPVLADNGGPTLTHALQAGSTAIDHAGACGLATDQRGFLRDALCDSGAYEFDALPPTEALGGTAAGIIAHRVRCQNFTMPGNVIFSPGGDSWDCEAEGLGVEGGDNVRMMILGRADGSGSVGGSTTGQSIRNVRCRNASTGQDVPLFDAPDPWDCEAAGLVVDAGDRIQMLVSGVAD